MKKFLSSIFLITTLCLILSSCGSDSQLSGANTSSSSTLANSCSCTSSYMPVCDTVKNISYENICLAKCYGASKTIQGNCICTNMPVCGNDGQTYTECAAVANIKLGLLSSITKFTDCNATPL